MAYIYRQKLDIRELVGQVAQPKKVLIMEPEVYAAALYAHHLSAADYFVKTCKAIDAIHADLGSFSPEVLVINPLARGSVVSAVGLLKKISSRYPGLRIVTVSLALDNSEISGLMAAGVNAHLDRRSTRPEDIVHIVKTILS